MRVGVASSNPNFIGGLLHELDAVRGHDVRLYQHTQSQENNYYQLGDLCATCDAVFVDFAQWPCEILLQEFPGRTIVRAHRVEMYSDGIAGWHWANCDALVFVADHVRQRFCERLEGNLPASVVTMPGVGVDAKLFPFNPQRAAEPPWWVMIAGNVVPKKRLYTALQMLADWPDEFCLRTVGSSGLPGYGNAEYHVNCTDLIQELGLAGRVDTHPTLPREELARLMAQSHIILSASNEEGCHSTIAEGMFTGCVPMVNCWRGAADLYGADAIWRSPAHLQRKLEAWAALTLDEKQAASQAAHDDAQRFDGQGINAALADIVEGGQPARRANVSAYSGPEQRQALRIVLDNCEAGGRLLDVNCGAGYVVSQAAFAGRHAVGIEPDAELLGQAQARSHETATYIHGNPADGLPEGPWDCISFLCALETLPRHRHAALLRSAAGKLAPGGKLVVLSEWGGDGKGDPRARPKIIRNWMQAAGVYCEVHGSLSADRFLQVFSRSSNGGVVVGSIGGDEPCE